MCLKPNTIVCHNHKTTLWYIIFLCINFLWEKKKNKQQLQKSLPTCRTACLVTWFSKARKNIPPLRRAPQAQEVNKSNLCVWTLPDSLSNILPKTYLSSTDCYTSLAPWEKHVSQTLWWKQRPARFFARRRIHSSCQEQTELYPKSKSMSPINLET